SLVKSAPEEGTPMPRVGKATRSSVVSVLWTYLPWIGTAALLLLSALWTLAAWKQNDALRTALERRRDVLVGTGQYVKRLTGVNSLGSRVQFDLDGRQSGSLVLTFS